MSDKRKERLEYIAEVLRANADMRRRRAELEATSLERFADAIEGMPLEFGDLKSNVEPLYDILVGDWWRALEDADAVFSPKTEEEE